MSPRRSATVAKSDSAKAGLKTGLARPGDVMPTLEEVMRRRRARAVGLPLSASIEEIERAENLRAGRNPTTHEGNALFAWESDTRNTSGPETPGPCPDWRWPVADQHGETMLRVELPWSVIVPDNAKHGVIEGRILNQKRYRVAKEKAHEIALASCAGQRYGEGCVEVRLHVWPPDRRKRDIANLLKLICDSLSGAAYTDDEQIVEQRIRREAVSRDNPRVVVMVTASPCP